MWDPLGQPGPLGAQQGSESQHWVGMPLPAYGSPGPHPGGRPETQWETRIRKGFSQAEEPPEGRAKTGGPIWRRGWGEAGGAQGLLQGWPNSVYSALTPPRSLSLPCAGGESPWLSPASRCCRAWWGLEDTV